MHLKIKKPLDKNLIVWYINNVNFNVGTRDLKDLTFFIGLGCFWTKAKNILGNYYVSFTRIYIGYEFFVTEGFMRKDLLGLEGLSREEIEEILDTADIMREHLDKGEINLDYAKGVSVVNLFYENSTRTRTSFENATKFLGANQVNIAVGSSSVAKGESMYDTVKTLESIKNGIVVIRHSMAGTPNYIAKKVDAHIVNAGDGQHEHPTQALLDMLTMRRHFGKIDGLTVAIIGDIKYSRVARSNIFGLLTMGAKVKLFGIKTLMPKGIEEMGATICNSVEEAIQGSDVVMGLRIQLERQTSGQFPTTKEYFAEYGITMDRMKLANENAIIMHPAPVNRGVEISGEAVDSDISRIFDQVTNGLAVRMAVIKLLAEGK